MSIVALLTDFGLKDGYVGVMKGVIWGIAPTAQIADITHAIQPQNVLEGALALGRAARYFPEGTVFIAVVDPGVGTARRPLAAKLGSRYFVGPDNGLFSVVLNQAEAAGDETVFYHLDRPEYWLKDVSNVFHGRDIFAPVGAHLAAGELVEKMGTRIADPLRIEIPRPVKTARGWRGQVLHEDAFGNLAANLGAAEVGDGQDVVIEIGGQTIRGLVKSFGERPVGELVAMLDSAGLLSIAVVNGSAAARLKLGTGALLEITIQSR